MFSALVFLEDAVYIDGSFELLIKLFQKSYSEGTDNTLRCLG